MLLVVSRILKLMFLVKWTDSLCASPFDVQSVASGSLVTVSRMFWIYMVYKMLGTMSANVVDVRYSMDKVTNIKQIYLIFLGLQSFTDGWMAVLRF